MSIGIKKTTLSVDGHYWIERKGKIIDPTPILDIQWKTFMKERGCLEERVYLPADKIVQQVMKKRSILQDERNKQNFKFMFGCDEPDNLHKWRAKNEGIGIKANCCYENCRIIEEDGDEIVFGSLGFKTKYGTVQYLYGGVNWVLADFIDSSKKLDKEEYEFEIMKARYERALHHNKTVGKSTIKC
jgi:hypothetical protein